MGLVRASDEMEECVRLMDVKFNVLHKSMTLRTGSNMLKRTVNFILRREECKNIMSHYLLRSSSSTASKV